MRLRRRGRTERQERAQWGEKQSNQTRGHAGDHAGDHAECHGSSKVRRNRSDDDTTSQKRRRSRDSFALTQVNTPALPTMQPPAISGRGLKFSQSVNSVAFAPHFTCSHTYGQAPHAAKSAEISAALVVPSPLMSPPAVPHAPRSEEISAAETMPSPVKSAGHGVPQVPVWVRTMLPLPKPPMPYEPTQMR